MVNKTLQKKLIRNFLISGKVKSTENRINSLQTNIEKLIHLAKRNTQASLNQISKTISNKKIEQKLYKYILPTFKDKNNGFLKKVKLNIRMSDGSKVSLLEWSLPVVIEKEKKEIVKSDKVKPKTKVKLKVKKKENDK